MVESSEIEALETQLDALETSISATTNVASAFQAGLSGMQGGLAATERSLQSVSDSLGSKLGNAFSDLVFEGAKLSDVLKDVARSMVESTFRRSVSPVVNGVGDAISDLIGGIFGGSSSSGNLQGISGKVTPFAKGGVVTTPTAFGMRTGTGLMGEAGPEAIMPLSRGADGALGVRTAGGSGAITVNMNITSPDAGSFQRSRTQVAAGLSRALRRGQRNY
jgi:phage-related minor tail protein